MSKQSEKLVAAFQTVADENRQETAKKIFAAELLKARNRRPLSGSALDARVEKLLSEASEEILEKAKKVLGVTLKPEEFSFPTNMACEQRLACEEAGECLGLCTASGEDDQIAAQAAMLAIAAEKGAKTVGEVLPEGALGGVDPEAPIIVPVPAPEPKPAPEPTPEPTPEPEPEPIVFEGRTYTVALTERGLTFTSTCGKVKEVLDSFCRWWQKATRRPITGAEGLFKAGNEELMRLLVANRDFLQVGAPRKPTPPPPTPASTAIELPTETPKAPESATTTAAEPAKTEEKAVTETRLLEALDRNEGPIGPEYTEAVIRAAETNARDLARAAEDARLDARKYLTEMRKRFHWAESSMNFTNEKLVRQLLSLFPISEAEAFDLVVESRKSVNAPVEAPIPEEATVPETETVVAPVSESTTNAPAPAPAAVGLPEETPDEGLDLLVDQEVKAREVLAEIDRRFPNFTGPSFTVEKVAARVAELAGCPIEMATRIVVESRKNNNPAPVEAPVTEETVMVQPTPIVPVQSVESNPAPVEAPKPEEKPVSQPQQQQQPVPVAAPAATEEAVKVALADLTARYAAHKAVDKKVANIRKETLTSIEARIKKGEWSKAMAKINEALKTVPEVPTAPVAPKAPVVEMPVPTPTTTVKGGVTVVQGVFTPQPIIPSAEPAPKPVIDVKPVIESTPAPSATTQAEQKPAEQKKEPPVAQQQPVETPKAPESATTQAPEAKKESNVDEKNDKKPGMWQRCKAWAERLDRKVHFKCGPVKEPEGMDKILSIVAAATTGVQPGEFISSTGTGPGVKIVRQAAEIVEEAINVAHMRYRQDFRVTINDTTLTLAQWTLMAEKQPELFPTLDEAKANFETQWHKQLPMAVPSIVEPPLTEFYRGSEEGVNRALVMSALVEAFHLRNPAKRLEDWKLDRKLVKSMAAGENITDAQVESLAKGVEKILNGGGAAEAKAMLRGLEAASTYGDDVLGLVNSIPDVAMAGMLITGAKVFMCCGNASVVSPEQMEALAYSNVIVEFDNLLTALANQKFASPKDPSRLDSLAGFGPANLGKVGQEARLYCIVQSAESLVGSEGGPEFVRLMIQIRSAKKVESLEKVKGGRGVVRKTTWAIYVAGKWTVLAVVAVVGWAFLPAKVVFYAGKAAAYKVASLFAGKDETKKAERNAAAGEAWACCVSSAKAIVMRPYGWAKRIVVGGYNKVKGWFGKSADQQTNGTEQSANEKEGTMGLFTGVLSQKFGAAKGAEFGKQSWYHKAASIAMSPFVASWRIAKTYTAEVVVAAASAGIAVIVGASALVVGGVAVAGAAVGMAARWIGRKFFGKKDETTTTAPAATTAPAQQAAA